MATALIGLGSNLGDRKGSLDRAIALLQATTGIEVTSVSSYRPSKPAGGPAGQDDFLNAAAVLETSLHPEELLAGLLRIEEQIGRVSTDHWGARVIDLDLLLYDRVEMKTPSLELPHPRMCFRRFVLEPAAEIAAEMIWPVNGWSVERLLQNLSATARYIAVSCVQTDFERMIGPIQNATGCRIVHEFTYGESLEKILGVEINHPPAHGMEQVLELQCRENSARLSPSTWPQDNLWTLSDFWAEAAFEFSADRLRMSGVNEDGSFFGKLRECRNLVQQPRLVVILDDGDDALASTYAQVAELRRLPESPPSLWLSAADPDRCADEVLAAMQAME